MLPNATTLLLRELQAAPVNIYVTRSKNSNNLGVSVEGLPEIPRHCLIRKVHGGLVKAPFTEGQGAGKAKGVATTHRPGGTGGGGTSGIRKKARPCGRGYLELEGTITKATPQETNGLASRSPLLFLSSSPPRNLKGKGAGGCCPSGWGVGSGSRGQQKKSGTFGG